MAGKSFVFRFTDVEVREREFSLTKAGERLAVEPKAFRVLLILVRNPGKLIPKQELLDAVWGDAAVTENSLARAVALLRKLLGDEVRTPKFIETVATVGYRFLGNVEAIEDPATAPAPIDSIATGPTPNGLSTAPVRTTSRWKVPAVAAVACVVLLGIGFWYMSRPLPPPRITAYTPLTQDGRDKSLAGTDGNRLYFTQSSPNAIFQVGINGGEIAKLSVGLPPGYMQLMDVSSDGSNALLRIIEEGHSASSKWVAPLLGGAPKRLEIGEGERFSPDGGSIIFSSPSGDIFTVRIDGSDRHKLASVGTVAFLFTWSPEGKLIRFSKQDGLWEMASDGTGIHRLLPGWKDGSHCCGQWTRDGSLFIFLADNQIWAIDERRRLFRRPSSVLTQLTSGPIHWGLPFPGKDGKRMFVEGDKPRGELTRIDPKTGAAQPFLDGISAENVSFSPDGRSVAYVAFPERTLWKANRDGSNRMQLIRPPTLAGNPRWSPDSKEIVFTSQSPDGHHSITRISAIDGTPLWLLPEETSELTEPNWSPDGTKVVFCRGTLAAPEKLDLRVVDLNTHQVTVVPGSISRFSPRWSPDGRYIAAFNWPEVNVNHLHVFDLKLQRWFDLPVNEGAEFDNFSHDGKFLYFIRYAKDRGVFRIPVAGGKEERIVDLTNWHLTGYFSYSLSLDPTDAPLVLRDVGTDDIYALTLEK